MVHGLENVSVEDIAAEANVSERTFRNYFASKAEAIVATHVERGHANRRGYCASGPPTSHSGTHSSAPPSKPSSSRRTSQPPDER